MTFATLLTPKRMLRGVAITAVAGLLAISLPMTASATASGGVGDVSDAMIYGETGPVGTVFEALRDEDDDTSTIAAPFPLNFFGTKYDALCISTNGTVTPVLTTDDDCTDEYNESLSYIALEDEESFISVLGADLDLSESLYSNGDEVTNDGFGEPANIYTGTTTVDGQTAVVVTWYRVLMNDDDNSNELSNTFQLVLIQTPTSDGDTAGYDFTAQFNYGTFQDDEDGYTADDCLDDCDRYGVGWANYQEGMDGAADTADTYELFATTPTTAFVDGKVTAFTNNSLNSAVPGRYTFSMVGGVTEGFVIPAMDGTASGTVPVEEPVVEEPVFTLDAVEPVPAPSAGQATTSENGVDVPSTVARNAAGTGVDVTGSDFSVSISGLAPDGTALPVDANGIVTFQSDGKVSVAGNGYAANSEVRVYFFSTPVLLGTVTTDSLGAFSASFPLPADVAVGDHTLQLRGYTTGGAVRNLNLGVRVIGPQLASTGVDAGSVPIGPQLAATGVDTGIVLGSSLMLLVLGAGATLVARRRLAVQQ